METKIASTVDLNLPPRLWASVKDVCSGFKQSAVRLGICLSYCITFSTSPNINCSFLSSGS